MVLQNINAVASLPNYLSPFLQNTSDRPKVTDLFLRRTKKMSSILFTITAISSHNNIVILPDSEDPSTFWDTHPSYQHQAPPESYGPPKTHICLKNSSSRSKSLKLKVNKTCIWTQISILIRKRYEFGVAPDQQLLLEGCSVAQIQTVHFRQPDHKNRCQDIPQKQL